MAASLSAGGRRRCDGIVHATATYQASSQATTELRRAEPSDVDAQGSSCHPRPAPHGNGAAEGCWPRAICTARRLYRWRTCTSTVHASAELRPDSSSALALRPVPCCPAALDAALQLASCLDAHADTGTPVAIKAFEWRSGASPARVVAHAGADGTGADVEMIDTAGVLIGIARGLQMAPAQPPLARVSVATLSTAVAEDVSTAMANARGASLATIIDDGVGSATRASRALQERAATAPTVARAASNGSSPWPPPRHTTRRPLPSTQTAGRSCKR